MNFQWFAHIIVHHSIAVILGIVVFSGTCLIIPFALKTKSLPTFTDPQLGFTTRGTTISNRLTSWDNLVAITKPSGNLTVNPKEFLYLKKIILSKKKKHHKNKKPKLDFGTVNYEKKNTSQKDSKSEWKLLFNLSSGVKDNLPYPELDGFCGPPDEKYAHFVIKSLNNENLFTLSSLLTVCKLEHEFINAQNFTDLCVQNTKTNKCCKTWSLGNYIAVLHNRTSCLGINEDDIESTMKLLKRCSSHFFNLKLTPDCSEKTISCQVPKECIKHDAVYNIFNFFLTTDVMTINGSVIEDIKLYETMIFLPLAASTAILPYFYTVENIKIESNIEVVAMDFGIKNALFDASLIHDAWFMVTGALFVLCCMWLYTKSLFLTLMTIIAIIFSLGISYFMYVLVFELKFFPFMNLLAIIVVIGIGSDDAFIFCKIWQTMKEEKNSTMVKIMSDTFHHVFFSLFVTMLTTSVAFLASYISSVTAVCCFSIFAGIAVVANYLLMITWFPACVIIAERSACLNTNWPKNFFIACLRKGHCTKILTIQMKLMAVWPKCTIVDKIWSLKQRYLLNCVIDFRYLWVLFLTGLAVGSIVIVLCYPKLQLPDSQEFQLFVRGHPFEQYDFVYKNHFWFHRESLNSDSNTNFLLPLRFVWGVLPIDNGDYLDPTNLGKISLDPSFNMSAAESQAWLLKFCRRLRRQPFFQPVMGSLFPSCFIETFIRSMQRDCIDPMSQKDRSPCCKSSIFPFNAHIFDECIIQEMADIYDTPSRVMIPGVAGPKFSKDQYPTIKAVVVEYLSNYTYSIAYDSMNEFYSRVEKWMNDEMKNAPSTMNKGWFISELRFYDLQRELAISTLNAIYLSMGLAFTVLLFSTLNILTSLYAIVTITCSIFVTISVLVMLGWKLNILESVAISTAIGLTVDFSLHYTINYRLCPIGMINDRQSATRFALSNMAGPALMAAITTGAAGAFMLPSLILPYIQIGIFLVTVMSVSWIYATFFLGSLLATIGPENNYGQFAYSKLLCYRFRGKTSSSEQNHPVSSISDAHELDVLTNNKVRNAPKSLQQSYSASDKNSSNRYVFTDQSPSATSAITIIMADEN